MKGKSHVFQGTFDKVHSLRMKKKSLTTRRAMMTERKYRRKYPDIADLLHHTSMTYVEIARKFGVTKQYIHWLNKRLGKFGRSRKLKAAAIRKTKIADEALQRFTNYSVW
jgi:hypothetical protein